MEDQDALSIWKRQYPLPAELDDTATLKHKRHLYSPPKSDAAGVAIACSVIGLFSLLFIHALFLMKLPFAPGVRPGEAASWLHVAAVFFSLVRLNCCAWGAARAVDGKWAGGGRL